MSKRFAWVAALTVVLACAKTAGATPINIVTNGGFETGDFTGWTQTGNTTFNGVQCSGPGPTVDSGNCSAFFGPIGSAGGIQQTLTTVANTDYEVTFAFLPDGGNPSSFAAAFAGVTLVSLTNPAASAAFKHFSFLATPTTSSSLLSFNFRDDPGFLFLDSVSVTQTPEPASLLLMGGGALAFLRKRSKKRAA